MILAIDVGNTNITCGLFEGKKILTSFRLTTNKNVTSDEFGEKISNIIILKGYTVNQIKDVIIASVVPCIMNSLNLAIKTYFSIEPIVLKSDMNLGINIKTESPKEVGIDRIVDMVAVKFLHKLPAIVIDFGTATTYDLIDENANYIAGVTSPGILTSLQGLVDKASKLTNINIELPSSVLAKNTKDSMKVGLIYGQIGQARYIINELTKESGISSPNVIITGGLGSILSSSLEDIAIYDIDLTMHGMRIIYDILRGENEDR